VFADFLEITVGSIWELRVG